MLMSESKPVTAYTLPEWEAFEAADVTFKDCNSEREALVHSCSVESLLTAASDSGPPAVGPPRSSRSVFCHGDALQPYVLTGNSSKDELERGRTVPSLESSHSSTRQSNTHRSHAKLERRLQSSSPEVARHSHPWTSESVVQHTELLDKFSNSRQQQILSNGSWSDALPTMNSSSPTDRPVVRQMPILPRVEQPVPPKAAVVLPTSVSRTTSTDSSSSTFTGHHTDGIQPMRPTDPMLTPIRPLETMTEVATAMGLVSAAQQPQESSEPPMFQVRNRIPVLPTDGSSGSGGGVSAMTANEQRVKSPTWVIEEVIDFGTPGDDNVREVEDSGELHGACIAVAVSAAPCSDRSSGLFGECTQTCNEERGCQ